MKAAKADKSANDQLHAQDYLVYAYLQLGQDKNARGVIDDMAAATFNSDAFVANFALAASPARYMVERGDWKGAAELEVHPSKFPHVMAITHFARALGAARSGNPKAAKADIAKLAELRDKLIDAKDAYWSQIVDIQYQVASAWELYAEGKYDAALKEMSAAADAEDKTEKHPVTPGSLAPARELYGYMLLDRGMAKEALAAFEASMAKEPNRFDGNAGTAKAAQALGDTAKAKAAYEKLIALASDADGDRPVLAEAKAFLAKN
jgi:tetratricopeptide (TPR) repeat protein